MIYRAKCGDIIFEFSVPEISKGVVVVCEGIPNVPKQKELMTHLVQHGYSVVYPRYRGTWESRGEFLRKSPAQDIADLVSFLKKTYVKELYAGKEFSLQGPIHLIGSSFGGSVALSLAENQDVHKIIALSPIVDFSKHNEDGGEADLAILKKFLQDAFPMGYRFLGQDWDTMQAGGLFNPVQEISIERKDDVLIAYDKFDTQISSARVREYCERNDLQTLVTKEYGHLSFSKISSSFLGDILNFLEHPSHARQGHSEF